MSNGARFFKVSLVGGEVLVSGNNKFHVGDNQPMRWEQEPKNAPWSFYHIAFGLPYIDAASGSPAPVPFPILNVALSEKQITASNTNKGGARRCMDYTLFLLKDGKVVQSLPFKTEVPGSENCPQFHQEDILQIENEPNGEVPDPHDRPPKGRPRH